MERNYLSHTFLLALMVVGGLCGMYFLPSLTVGGKTLRRVDLLADVRSDPPVAACDSDTVCIVLPKPVFVDTCRTGMTCIEDYADSTRRGMEPFYEALRQGKFRRRPVRVAYFGDSFIEGDILTADLRRLLREDRGGCGVGYVPVTSIVSGFRTTVRHTFEGWESHAATDTAGFRHARQGLSGHYFLPRSEGAWVELRGDNRYDSCRDTCETATLYFLSPDSVAVRLSVNGGEETVVERAGDAAVQALVTEGRIGRIRWSVERADSAVFFGVAMDGRTGVCVDNLSLRGSGGLPLRAIPQTTLRGFARLRPYDLIVLQYGLNVATELGYDYSSYRTGLTRVIEHLKAAFPNAGVLVVGIGDREGRDGDGRLRTFPGVRKLVRFQQAAAAEAHVAFWNLYEAMGGEGSMARMVEEKMANLDYTHINFKGGRRLAELLYDALTYGEQQYERRREYEE